MDKVSTGMSGLVFALILTGILTWFAGMRAEAGNLASADAASMVLQTGTNIDADTGMVSLLPSACVPWMLFCGF